MPHGESACRVSGQWSVPGWRRAAPSSCRCRDSCMLGVATGPHRCAADVAGEPEGMVQAGRTHLQAEAQRGAPATKCLRSSIVVAFIVTSLASEMHRKDRSTKRGGSSRRLRAFRIPCLESRQFSQCRPNSGMRSCILYPRCSVSVQCAPLPPLQTQRECVVPSMALGNTRPSKTLPSTYAAAGQAASSGRARSSWLPGYGPCPSALLLAVV